MDTNGTTAAMIPAKIVILSPMLRRLLGHWHGLPPGAGGLPGPCTLDPVEIAWALGAISLVDVIGEPPACRFRYALDGSSQVEHYGFDMTGKTLEEFPKPEMRASIRESYIETVAARRPLAVLRDSMLDGWRRRCEALLLPFGEGECVTRLAVALDFDVPPA